MAMTAWSAKVSRSAICHSENGRRVGAPMIAPIGTPSRSIGTASTLR